jgi:hypothetical protein
MQFLALPSESHRVLSLSLGHDVFMSSFLTQHAIADTP